jgi:5-methylcytosine-specific restriction protein A
MRSPDGAVRVEVSPPSCCLQGLPTLFCRLFYSVLMPLLQTLRPRLSAQPVERAARVLQPPGTARMTSRPWARLRAKVLMSNPLCVKCAATGRVQAAHEVDHIVPLHSGGTHDRSNLQPLCRPCHADKTATEAGSRARGDAWGGIKRFEG